MLFLKAFSFSIDAQSVRLWSLQDLITRPVMCWWPWSSSPLTSLKVSTWIEKRKTWEPATRSVARWARARCPEADVLLMVALRVLLVMLQGLMFGYATDETEECMPLTIILAHKLNIKMAELRRNKTLPWLRPDSKTQVRWENGFH